MKDTKEISAKKLYRTPKFHVYGNIRDLTQAVGNMGGGDGGIPNMHKSQT